MVAGLMGFMADALVPEAYGCSGARTVGGLVARLPRSVDPLPARFVLSSRLGSQSTVYNCLYDFFFYTIIVATECSYSLVGSNTSR